MKIVFEGSELKDGTIKISLDGGFTFTEYKIADVKDGFHIDDSQDYRKIMVKGPANILKNLDVVSNVKIEGGTDENSLPITPIYYDYIDGGCGYEFYIKEASCSYSPNYNFNPKVLYVKIGDDYISLQDIFEGGHLSHAGTPDITGDLYVLEYVSGSCPPESYYIRVRNCQMLWMKNPEIFLGCNL